ncbi:hypothetical protein ASPZODRAFT_68530 [Penicilliopsis zonata CBS 506.65]|uniref:BTB domain-containing protein n=1 Tax=Penicilliopsis zonata CBS 506.65 TaxID=1073090 RepID=A0A1L9SES5_9EURO|nr:hypothetical protein ASPZODRAFT_68530 [Penicilliopsis zonata CBS 506.65]OJJ45706.1 hypothetical protein ASPZODRAFT_68530 [Penicilliopsis zonata CBS 506.65]
MDAEGLEASLKTLDLQGRFKNKHIHVPPKVISNNGDVIIQLDGFQGAETHRWQVNSEDLIRNSPYFRALLDPNKFIEGRTFMEQKAVYTSQVSFENDTPLDEGQDSSGFLPSVHLPTKESALPRLGMEAVELFLKILCSTSLDCEAKEVFHREVKYKPVSLVAKVVEIADIFNSPQAVRTCLHDSAYAYGKNKNPFYRFSAPLLKMSEDRLRQALCIAIFLQDEGIVQVLSHTLVIAGSKVWVNGVAERRESPRWTYFPAGIEEELYYRRQCVLNTITDLQAYFLRIYGALEDEGPSTTPTHQVNKSRPFQCRWGFDNSSACDSFHLGQMMRFFALRTKTIFLGSTLIDPDFSLEDEEEEEEEEEEKEQGFDAPLQPPPTDILALIASLKQCPDYQIDLNHSGCGIRRRLLPALECIERFVGDQRGLLGITLRHGHPTPPASVGTVSPLRTFSWRSPSLQRAQTVNLRFAKIISVGPASLRSGSQEEDARLLFTSKKRNWEA